MLPAVCFAAVAAAAVAASAAAATAFAPVALVAVAIGHAAERPSQLEGGQWWSVKGSGVVCRTSH